MVSTSGPFPSDSHRRIYAPASIPTPRTIRARELHTRIAHSKRVDSTYLRRQHAEVHLTRLTFIQIVCFAGDLLEIARRLMQTLIGFDVAQDLVGLWLQKTYLVQNEGEFSVLMMHRDISILYFLRQCNDIERRMPAYMIRIQQLIIVGWFITLNQIYCESGMRKPKLKSVNK